MNASIKNLLRLSCKFTLRNQRRNLLTHNSLGMDEFLQFRQEKQEQFPDFNIDKKRYQNYFLEHGSKFLSSLDVGQLLDFSETKEDIDMMADILCSVCEYKYSRWVLLRSSPIFVEKSKTCLKLGVLCQYLLLYFWKINVCRFFVRSNLLYFHDIHIWSWDGFWVYLSILSNSLHFF